MLMKSMPPHFGPMMKRLEFLQTVIGATALASASSIALPVLGSEGRSQPPAFQAQNKKSQRMIIDQLQRAERYFSLHPDFEKAFAFLRQKSIAELAVGKHEIEGERIYCTVSKGPGRKRSEAKLEAHRRYIDIQYIIQGTDEIGWKPTADCQAIDQEYDPVKDILFFKDEPLKWGKVTPGSFALFFPRDAHAPLVSAGEIHKVVVKVAVPR
jgi:YhcH/YjgK/YiaL family protein